ncbi:MAG TPA: Nif3-like dinuclear metal center hexameric protein [Candidatus Nitrosopolaris sp.]|nr:Nif3-like dinuclear metal center hexameric protein [Candidatus Nitrosopolaris sp.]
MSESKEIHMDKMTLCSSLRVGHLQVIRDFSGAGSDAFTLCTPAEFCFYRVMPKPSLIAIVNYCDRILRPKKIQDNERAVNGLQMENRGGVTRIAAAVDASLATVKRAIAAGADLMIVHHGLFWSARQPWTAKNHELLQLLVENNLAIYSAHLPLDFHPRLGNNALLCAALGLKNPRPFLLMGGQHYGLQSRTSLSRSVLAARLHQATGERPLVIQSGPEICRRIGVVTGGAGEFLPTAAGEGVDTFVTGEGPHWTYAAAEELGLNVLYGGHYATETFGVKALAAHLSQKFKVPWRFLDHPTGL